MNFFKTILAPEVQKFVMEHDGTDPHALLLKKSPFPKVSMQDIVQQMRGRKVAEKKFPFLLNEKIVFPPNLNLEQCSSEATARYKSSLCTGKRFADVTSGFGIDAYFISKNFEKTTLVEQDKELLEMVAHNWSAMQKSATFVNQSTEHFLQSTSEKFDTIFIDPARRDTQKRKVFLLEDLSPNILDIQEQLLSISEMVLVKLSPLIDITYLLSVLRNVKEIHVVAVKNDVKEILALLHTKSGQIQPKIIAVNLESKEPKFEVQLENADTVKTEYSKPLKYLYIPNNAVLKTGAFHQIAHTFNLKKLHPNTHLYTSANLVHDFPGRNFEVEEVTPSSLKKGEYFNIISKNYPLKPEEIKKKYKLKDGGNQYLIFTQTLDRKIILKSR